MKAEDLLSCQVAAWCSAFLPDNVFATCIAHGARHFRMAVKLKQMGVKSGVPDWMLIYNGRGVFVELKTGRGGSSRDQKDAHGCLAAAGCSVFVIRTLDEFVRLMHTLQIPRLHHPRGDPGLPNDEVGF